MLVSGTLKPLDNRYTFLLLLVKLLLLRCQLLVVVVPVR